MEVFSDSRIAFQFLESCPWARARMRQNESEVDLAEPAQCLDLMSLGEIVAAFQVDPRIVPTSLMGIGARPRLVLNGTQYWDTGDVVTAMREIAKRGPGGKEVKADG